jgi:hypothetical protein
VAPAKETYKKGMAFLFSAPKNQNEK